MEILGFFYLIERQITSLLDIGEGMRYTSRWVANELRSIRVSLRGYFTTSYDIRTVCRQACERGRAISRFPHAHSVLVLIAETIRETFRLLSNPIYRELDHVGVGE